jgi:hypothetical protein
MLECLRNSTLEAESMSSSRYCLTHLDDNQLLTALTHVAGECAQLLADLLAHLAEVDSRKLYLEKATSSLFVYCTERLGFSEDETCKRIQAARAARAYPVIFELVAQGRLHLSAINLLAPHLTKNNHEELLGLACGKSKRQVEELLAARFSQPDVLAVVRKLPAKQQTTTSNAAPQLALATLPHEASSASTPMPTATPSHGDEGRPSTSFTAIPKSAALLAPLSAERFKLQVTLTREARDQLLHAQALLRHRLPSGDLGEVIARALSCLCAELEAQRFGRKRGRDRNSKHTTDTPLIAAPD